VIPIETANKVTALNPSDQYTVATGISITSPVAFDAQGNLYYENGGSTVNKITLGTVSLGSTAVSSSSTGTFDVIFNGSAAPAAFTFTGSTFTSTGGTCAAGSYTAGQSCTITAKFSPKHPGVYEGYLAITDASSDTLASAYLSGIGLGAGITLDPGAATSIGSGFKTPQAIAVTENGGYVADVGADAVLYFSGTSSTPVSIGSGLSKPSGVAVDGAGNVFIADTGNNQIVEVPVVNGAPDNTAQVTVVSSKDTISSTALSGPTSINVDAQGNLYIADMGNMRVIYLPYNRGWQVSEASVVDTITAKSLTTLATTVDPSGNLYVADSGSGQIYELPAPVTSGVQNLVAVGFSNPSALATDASGSLFVVDQGANTVLRIPLVSGSLNPNDAIEVGYGVADPYGVAVDPQGNLYVTDATNAAAYEVARTSIDVNFGDWAVSTASGAVPFQIENEGNQELIFNTPYSNNTGDAAEFTFGTPNSACTDGGTVAAGASCEVDPIFEATTAGSWSYTLAFSSNAQNASAPEAVLSATSTAATSTSTVLVITSPTSGTPYFGEPVTLTATVTAASGTPTGSAELLVDGLVATESSLSSGVATFSLATGLTGGSHTLQAVYLGSTSFAGSISTALTISVSTAPTTTTLAITAPYTNPYSSLPGGTVSFTGTVNLTGTGIPTGTITFASNGTTLGTVTLATVAGGAFEAAFTSTTLPLGTDVITATYSGDANYVGSSASGTVTVVSAATLVLTSSGTTLTANEGNSGYITFSNVSEGGWTGIVGYSCLASSLPANARCVWSPGQAEVLASTAAAPATTSTVTLKIAIDQPPTTPTASKMLWWMGGLSGLLLFFVRRRFARGAWATTTMLLGLLLLGASATGLMACNNNTSIEYVTPTGTTTVTVYASADPFTQAPSSSDALPSTQSCGVNSTTNLADPSLAPCSQQTYQIAVTVN
jgi:sugar lactone lactonase YvrE